MAKKVHRLKRVREKFVEWELDGEDGTRDGGYRWRKEIWLWKRWKKKRCCSCCSETRKKTWLDIKNEMEKRGVNTTFLVCWIRLRTYNKLFEMLGAKYTRVGEWAQAATTSEIEKKATPKYNTNKVFRIHRLMFRVKSTFAFWFNMNVCENGRHWIVVYRRGNIWSKHIHMQHQ